MFPWDAPFPAAAEWQTQRIESTPLVRRTGKPLTWTGSDVRDGKDLIICAARTNNERLAKASLYKEVEFFWWSVIPVAASK